MNIMTKSYRYVGPSRLFSPGSNQPSDRLHVQQARDVLDWIARTRQVLEKRSVIVTFIVDAEGDLWIDDRHSEHVACADGQPVLSAGEMTLLVKGAQVSVAGVTNQSLGYCPE